MKKELLEKLEKERNDPSVIICSIDKDLKGTPGWHYEWPHHGNNGKLYWVSQEEADKWFYIQLLMGDKATDNIEGIKGIGEKKARKILKGLTTVEDMYRACLKAYEDHGMNYFDLLETANLIYIQREHNVLWTPPV